MDEDTLPERLAARTGASRTEVVGLGVLVVGALLVLVVLWWWQRPGPVVGPTDVPSPPVGASAGVLTSGEVVVHVTGAVVTPGVVSLVDGARVVDAIEAAGGVRADADLSRLNLARLVVDGEQILVPVVGTSADGGGGAAGQVDDVRDAEGRLNLNRATAADLEELPGVGPVLAERIVRHREEHGPFAAPGDLRAVAGIGEKTFQNLAPYVWV